MALNSWTEQQKKAIDVRKGTLLLAAAAGSGKTAVLVQRVIDILCDFNDPVEPKELLVVTFTNAAAAQMNQRITDKLQELSLADPSNAYLRKQLALLSSAQISTVHSYCMNLIRANFHLLGIQPDVRLGDQSDMNLLMADLIEESIEHFYELDLVQQKNDFAKLVKLFSSGGDDRNLASIVANIYRFLRSRPFYNDWLDEALRAYDTDLPIEQTIWGKIILDYSKTAVRDVMRELLSTDSKEADIVWCKELEQVINNGVWDEIFKFVQTHLADRRSNSNAKALSKQLGESLFCCDEDVFRRDLKHLKPIISTLFDLVRDFDERFFAEKQKRHLIDFADLEHFAIQLLVTKNSDGSYSKTPLAQDLSKSLRYVLVDEYQDTNQTQSLIFQSLSNDDNLFMVGDIKQSIYRFRQADPSIFLGKKQEYFAFDGENFPATLLLMHNFRSRREVTDSVNYVFSHIMSAETAELDYTKDEFLIAAASFPENPNCVTEYHQILTDNSKTDGSEAAQDEAFVVAKKIRELLDSQMLISENSKQRKIQAGDICVLLRSPKTHGEIFMQALIQENIPVISEVQESYLDTIEISTAVSLLRVIENPLLDIHLTAALMSCAFQFNADDMAKIRIFDRSRALYLNIIDLANQGDFKCAEFISKLQDYRLRAAAEPSWQVLQYIIEDCGLMAFAAALDNGEKRQANLRLLVQYAQNCENWGYSSIAGLLRFLDKAVEKNEEIVSAPAPSSENSAVKIMSIHKSKGLEFPVVFLCETSRSFNIRDITQDIILHQDYGFACISDDELSETAFATVPLEALRLAYKKQMLAEEMRILYVAMTRAREKLIITSVKKPEKDNQNVSLPTAFEVKQAKSYADWLDLVMRFYERDDMKSPLFEIVQEHQEKSDDEDIAAEKFLHNEQADYLTLLYLQELLSSSYSDIPATKIPSKLTVTQIAKANSDEDEFFSKEPNFLKEKNITAAQKGTAMHQYMSCANHIRAKDDIEAEIQRLLSLNYFTEAEARSLNRRNIAAYYKSDLFARINRASWVKTEFPFLMDMGREDLQDVLPEIAEHRVTVQGIADLIFEEDNAIILVDFKTDHLDEFQLAEKYKPQLDLYEKIISRLFDKPIKEKIIYSMYLKKSLKI